MNQGSKYILPVIIFFFFKGNSQPFIDIANFNYQNFSAASKNNTSIKSTTDIYSLNLLFPKELKNGNALLFRMNGESIQSSINSLNTSKVSSLSIALGYQWYSENKKWKSLVIGIPKIASDFKESIDGNDWQYGALFIVNYKFNPKLQIKAGLYFNKEAFGNFLVPLIGIDWKASDKLYCYGILPTNYKIEYTIVKKKVYTGLNFKAFTRSFQLSEEQNNDYIRFDEVVLKGFVEYFCFKNILAYSEIGKSFGKSPLQYKSNSKDLSYSNANYSPIENHIVFSFGLAYRIRTD
jgi:hypothetical protein